MSLYSVVRLFTVLIISSKSSPLVQSSDYIQQHAAMHVVLRKYILFVTCTVAKRMPRNPFSLCSC